MDLDFSAFLLNYTKRFFLKIIDIANLLILIIAIFVAIFAVIISSQAIIQIYMIPLLVVLSVFGILVRPYLSLKSKHKKNNELILKIEKLIILNYDYINKRSDMKKIEILDQLNLVFAKSSNENIKKLENLLSNPES